jgi:hypothetical protein
MPLLDITAAVVLTALLIIIQRYLKKHDAIAIIDRLGVPSFSIHAPEYAKTEFTLAYFARFNRYTYEGSVEAGFSNNALLLKKAGGKKLYAIPYNLIQKTLKHNRDEFSILNATAAVSFWIDRGLAEKLITKLENCERRM